MKIHWIMLLLLLPLASALDYPSLDGFVTDTADILSPEEEVQLEALMKQIEEDTTAEIAIVTIATLDGEDKESVATKLFEDNGIGKKDVDNGLLILIVPEDRVYRVEVGYGLEGAIPDASKVNLGVRILEPHFKEGNFGTGLLEVLPVIKGLIEEDPEIVSAYQSTYVAQRGLSSNRLIWIFVFFMILSSVLSMGGRRNSMIFMPIPIGGGWNGGSGGFGSSGFGGFGGGMSGGGGFGGSF